MSSTKMVFLGAGSMRFAREIIIDLCVAPGLAGSEVVLVDPDELRLQTVLSFAKAYAQELGVPLRFSAETDRTRALADAQFVICAALAGGRDAMERDRSLLESFGYYRGIGINTPYRQLALMLAIARDMARLCPKALHLMAANPVPEVCQLITQETGIQTVGICHGHLAVARVAALLGLDPGLLDATIVGMNHCIWALRLSYDGRDAYPMLDEWIQAAAPAFYACWLKQARNADYPIAPVALDLYRLYGLCPVGDSCRASTPETWWYHQDLTTKQRWYGPTGGRDGDIGHQESLSWLRGLLTDLHTTLQDDRLVSEVFPPQASSWQIVPIIDSIVNNRPSIQQVSILNQGTLVGLSDECFVEVPARVDAAGFHALEQYQLPAVLLQGMLRPRQLLCDRIVSAMRTGDIRFLLQTFLSDHKTTSYEQAVRALSAVVAADPGMAEHYRGTLPFLREGISCAEGYREEVTS